MVVKVSDKCIKCGGCVGVCPVNALTLNKNIECNNDCTNCKICVNFCPVGALKIKEDE